MNNVGKKEILNQMIDINSGRNIAVIHMRSEVLLAASVKTLVLWAVTSGRLKMETEGFSKTCIFIYKTAWHPIPQDHNLLPVDSCKEVFSFLTLIIIYHHTTSVKLVV
jgi:hypothetical protein